MLNLFNKYGPIKQVHDNARQGPTGRDAIITYSRPEDAITAMTNLNATMFKNQKVKIRMSNNKGSFTLKEHKTSSPNANVNDNPPTKMSLLRSSNLHRSYLCKFKTSIPSRKVQKENAGLLRITRQNPTMS